MIHCKPAACILIFLAATAAAPGQTALQVFDPIRSRDSISESEQQQIRTYVDEAVANLQNGADDQRTIRRFREEILSNQGHAANSVAFKRAFTEACSQRFAPAIQQGGKLGRILTAVLAEMSDPRTLEVLQSAAGSKDESIRAVAIQGIRQLRPALQSDEGVVASLIPWLEQAGKAETSPIVLPLIYQAFEYETRQAEQAQAVLSILRERLAAFQSGAQHPSLAEVQAFARLKVLVPGIPDNARPDLVAVLAGCLAVYAHEFIYVDIDHDRRTDLLRLTALVEDLLAQLTGGPLEGGGVAGAMGSASPQRSDAVLKALQSWVGGPHITGRLNGAPWQVPAGGGTSLDFSAAIPEHPEPAPPPNEP